MTLTALRTDALSATDGDRFELRLGLPWIRSMPLASLTALTVTIDGVDESVTVSVGGRELAPGELAAEAGWWFIQDRLVIRGIHRLAAGPHDVAVSFVLIVPYLQSGPDSPLALPFHLRRALVLDAAAPAPTVARDVA